MLDYRNYITLIENINEKIYANDIDTKLTIENTIADLAEYVRENNLSLDWFIRNHYIDFNDFGNHKLSNLAFSMYHNPSAIVHCNDGIIIKDIYFYNLYLSIKDIKIADYFYTSFVGGDSYKCDFFEYDINNIKLKKRLDGFRDYNDVPPRAYNKYLQQQQQYKKTPSNTKNSISYIITVYEKTDLNHLKKLVTNLMMNSPIADYEIVLVNNFHNGFKEKEREFVKNFNHLKIVKKEKGNRSVYEGYLFGVKNASKEFIWVIDSDDDVFILDNIKEIEEPVKFIIVNMLPSFYKYNFSLISMFGFPSLIFRKTFFEMLLNKLELTDNNVNCYGLLDSIVINCICGNLNNSLLETIDASDTIHYYVKEDDSEHVSTSDSYIVDNYKNLDFFAKAVNKIMTKSATFKAIREELLMEIVQAPIPLSEEFIISMIDAIVEKFNTTYEDVYITLTLMKNRFSTYNRIPEEKETGNIVILFNYLRKKIGPMLKAIDYNSYNLFKYVDKIKEIGEKYNIYTTDDKFVINILLFGDKYKQLKITKRSQERLKELYGDRDDVVINYLDENFLNEFKAIPSTAFVLNESEDKPLYSNCVPDYIKIIYSVLDKEVCWLDSDIYVIKDFIPLLKEKKYCCGELYNIGELSYYKGINDFYFRIFLAHNKFMDERVKKLDTSPFTFYSYVNEINGIYSPKKNFDKIIPKGYYKHYFTSIYGKVAKSNKKESCSITLDKELLDDYIKVFEINNEIDDNSHN